MQLDKFDQPLEQYLNAITLTPTQDARISSALVNISELALAAYPDAEIYAQGSYALDALAKPLTEKQGGGTAGEYDIDIAIEREDWDGAAAALEEVAELAESDSVYGKMSIDKTKNSCVRIEYAPDDTGVSFHIDLVPTKREAGERFVANRANDEWKSSDAKQFVDWFNELAADEPNLRPLIVIMKRLRDLSGLTDDLKSIMIVALVTRHYSSQGSLMGDLATLLEEIVALFANPQSPPVVANPVNQGENLADGLGDYATVRAFFKEVNDKLGTALADDNAEALKELFGPGFNYAVEDASPMAAAAVVTLPAQPARAYGGDNDQDF